MKRSILFLVCMLLAMLLVHVEPASALSVTTPEPVTLPASVIADLIGDVLPESGAAQAAGVTLGRGSSGGLNVFGAAHTCSDAKAAGTYSGNCLVYAGKTFAASIPGFQLGFKVGGWIDQATGLVANDVVKPDPSFVPYNGESVGSAGFQNSNLPYSIGCGNGCGTYSTISGLGLVPDAAVWIYGQSDISIGTGPGQGGATMTQTINPDGNFNQSSFSIGVYCKDSNGVVAADPTTYSPVGPQRGQGSPPGSYTSDEADASALFCRSPLTFDHLESLSSSGLSANGPADIGAVWAPAGYPSTPPSDSPPRQWITTVTCRLVGGTELQVTGLSPAFAENDAQFPAYPIAQCPDGSVPIAAKIEVVPKGGRTPIDTIIQVKAPVSWSDWLERHPNCWNGNCPVLLMQRQPDGTFLSCFDNKTGCEQWFSDPDKATKFKCSQDGEDLPLSDCNFYSPSFDPLQAAKGISYGDPHTGAVVKPSGKPADNPAGVGGASSGSGGSSCLPSGWSAFNPIEWVLDPIKCAFIPSDSGLNDFVNRIKTAYDESPLPPWIAALSIVGQIQVPDGGCGGVVVTFPAVIGGASFHMFATCDEPWHTIAFIVKAFLVVGIVWGTILTVVRNLAAAFGLEIHWGSRGH